jgi:hypothetical protein
MGAINDGRHHSWLTLLGKERSKGNAIDVRRKPQAGSGESGNTLGKDLAKVAW